LLRDIKKDIVVKHKTFQICRDSPIIDRHENVISSLF